MGTSRRNSTQEYFAAIGRRLRFTIVVRRIFLEIEYVTIALIRRVKPVERVAERTEKRLSISVWIPGLAQWSWGQRGRSAAILLTFTAAIFVAVFTWGTWFGAVMLAAAFAMHAASLADSIRQTAFPPLGTFAPWCSAIGSLGITVYLPGLALATFFAFPVFPVQNGTTGYAINRWAFQGQSPRPGQLVVWNDVKADRLWLARVVASGGQRIRWPAGIAAESPSPETPAPTPTTDNPGWTVSELELEIPADHVLLSLGADPKSHREESNRWVLVARNELMGRAWARIYPVWNRRFLL